MNVHVRICAGGCAVLRIPTVTGGRARQRPLLPSLSAPFGVGAPGTPSDRRRYRSRLALSSGADSADGRRGARRRQTPGCRPRARPGYRRFDGRTPAQALCFGGFGGLSPPPGAGEPPTETPGRGEGGEAGGSGRFFPARGLCPLDTEAAGRSSDGDGDRREHLEGNGAEDSEKKEIKPWLKQYGCIPPSRNAPFVAAMEEVLDTYQRDFAEDEVWVCMDETSRQQTKETRLPRPVRPGQPEIVDYEYERNGTANLFLAFAPNERRSSSGNSRTILSPERRLYWSWTTGTRTAPHRCMRPLHPGRPCGCESGSSFGTRRSTEAGSTGPRSKSARGRDRVFDDAFLTAPPCCGRPRRGSSAATRPAAPSTGGSRRQTPG